MVVLLVAGHLRNYYDEPRRFIDGHLSRFDVDSRLLYTHSENGWWTGDMSKTLDQRGEAIDLSKVDPSGFFEHTSFIDMSQKQSMLPEYAVLPLHPDRLYVRESSYKEQIVNRYLLMKQVLREGMVCSDDVVVMTRPDILPKDNSMLETMRVSVSEFSNSDFELLLFYAGGIPHDCTIVGRASSLCKLFSPEAYNTNQYAQPHENLKRMGDEMFKTRTVLLHNSYYYANSPGMKQYGV
jgi:hypothetical protein